ncbi:MAG: galactofuranosyltransferase [Bacteroidaceae bacterium]|nr:galactofuranosyltransferase [Bacteroidaceae bacterium]
MNTYLKISTNNKAKQDIDQFMADMGFRNLAFLENKDGKVARFFAKLFAVGKLPFVLHKGDLLLIQYPFKKYYSLLCRIARMKGAKTITLIHDLGTFRRHKLTAEQEIDRLSRTDYIISHNQSMTDWLLEHGCKVKIGNLEIFDYISPNKARIAQKGQTPLCNFNPVIIYAGGLGKRKNAYLYDMDNILDNLSMKVYGKGLDEKEAAKWAKVKYEGFMPSDQFIASVEGDWGLVWDGDSVDGCTGNWGEYLRINNPHKTSFYLRAGLPVILWKEAAMAPFIEKEKIGITVSSLRELPEKIASITPEEYAVLKQNAELMAKKLNEGYHFKQALDKAFTEL